MSRTGRRVTRILLLVVALGAAGAAFSWPKLFPGNLARGTTAYSRGEWKAALELARKHLEANPKDPEGLRLLARASFRLGRDRSARTIYGNLGGTDAMKAEDLYLLGLVFHRTGENLEAEDCWQKGLKDDPEHPGTLKELAELYLVRQQFPEAEGFARKLSLLPGHGTEGDVLLARVAWGNEDPETVVETLKRVHDRETAAPHSTQAGDDSRKLHARALLRLGKGAEARNLLEGVACDPEGSWLLSRAYLQEGDLARAGSAVSGSNGYRQAHPTEREPAPYVGAARCAECHKTIHRTQQSSHHARTFKLPGEVDPTLLPKGPVADPNDPRWSYEVKKVDGALEFQSRSGNELNRAVIDYAFGSGDRGLTLVGKDEQGRTRECRMSYFSDGHQWDVTSGHPPKPPEDEHGLGRVLGAEGARACFNCHTTAPRDAMARRGPTVADHSIGCERCHGPGGNHVAAVAAKDPSFTDLAIAQPSKATAEQVVQLCGQCHGPVGDAVVLRDDPVAVRFQAKSLTWSRCFKESDGKLDCRTCHNPHRDADHTPARYEAICLGCHGGASRTGDAAHTDTVAGAPCPVNPKRDCLGCHMPVTRGTFPHTTFTDHDIRVRTKDRPGVKASPAPAGGTGQ